MKDRIKHYIEHKGISAGELAVLLDVQRSNISHILNGRNKPGAVFIEKLLIAFPDLNARWLLTGEGLMTEEAYTEKDHKNKLPFAVETRPDVDAKQEPKLIVEEKTPNNPIVNAAKALSNPDEVEKMILVYKDGTFATFCNRGNH